MKRGFTLVEMSLGLFFSSLILLIVFSVYLLIFNLQKDLKHFDQNRIGLIQLQNEVILGSEFESLDDQICFIKFEEHYCLKFDQSRLVKTPGYEIFLVDIEEGSLSLETNKIQFKSKSLSQALQILP